MLFLFHNFVLDTDRRELRSGTSTVAVEPQVFDLLEFLIRKRDHVVSRDDLIEHVWKGRIVSESALASRINAARRVIGDDGAHQTQNGGMPFVWKALSPIIVSPPGNSIAPDLVSRPNAPPLRALLKPST